MIFQAIINFVGFVQKRTHKKFDPQKKTIRISFANSSQFKVIQKIKTLSSSENKL
jgi:hypothetical protein